MYISTNWIKDFVDLDGIDIEKLIYQFTMSTAEVEGITKYGFDTNGVVVGKVESIQKISNSDKLSKVIVDIGEQKVQSVCGANNIFEGALIPFAKYGSQVLGKKVEKNRIDGIESNGVCLSEKELGISQNHDGVMILSGEYEIGTDIKNFIPLEDIIFEVDNKSITNRPDLWGHYGIAREIAAITKRELKELPVDDLELYHDLKKLDITVENGEQCYRYTGITVENISKNVSPYTMKVRLYYTGLRSINLLADITNYVMLEIGQPMHAFDKKLVEKIEVATLKKEENFVTLDGVSRVLPEGTLMIRNENKPIGIAGIMGGLESQITEKTNSLFLESATFDSTLIRKTAMAISHRTDASARYEKTLDPEFAKIATARFLKILKENDANVKVTSSFTDVYPKKYPKVEIDIDKPFFDRYIGIDIPMETIVETLENLKYLVTRNGEKLHVEVPSFRATKDVTQKADLIEEVARIYGYDNITPKSNLWKVEPIEEDATRVLEYEVKRMLAEKYGMSEIHSYVWYNEELNKQLEIEVADNLKIVNGLNKADSTLREKMGPTMLYALNHNLRYQTDCNIFEIGRTFEYHFDGQNCKEKKVLGIALSSIKKTEKELMYQAKSIIETIFQIQKNLNVTYRKNDGSFKESWIHKVNSYLLEVEGKIQGYISVLHPKIKDNIHKKSNIVLIELRVDDLAEIENKKIIYDPITKYQTVNLDLTFTVEKGILFESMKAIIEQVNLPYLMEYHLVDIYENEEKLPGKKSVSIRFVIGSKEKTLSKEEIDLHMNTLIDSFEKENMIVNR